MLKAIETVYKGYRFRSRLEARWAVFFDNLGIEFEYEKEGFELGGDVGRYLPDFYLPAQRLWVEIKGQLPSEFELKKARMLADQGNTNVLILAGNLAVPTVIGSYYESEYAFNHSFTGTLLVGNLYWTMEICDDIEISGFNFQSLCEYHLKEHYGEHPEWFSSPIPDFDISLSIYKKLIELDKQYYQAEYKKEHPKWVNGLCVKDLTWCGTEQTWPTTGKPVFTPKLSNFMGSPDMFRGKLTPMILEAYTTAQQARFEHGETPLVRN